jgi:hypothetical protein
MKRLIEIYKITGKYWLPFMVTDAIIIAGVIYLIFFS